MLYLLYTQEHSASKSEGIHSLLFPRQGAFRSPTGSFRAPYILWRRKACSGKGKRDPAQNPGALGSALRAANVPNWRLNKRRPARLGRPTQDAPGSGELRILSRRPETPTPAPGAAGSKVPCPPPAGRGVSNGAACPGRGHARLAARSRGRARSGQAGRAPTMSLHKRERRGARAPD